MNEYKTTAIVLSVLLFGLVCYLVGTHDIAKEKSYYKNCVDCAMDE